MSDIQPFPYLVTSSKVSLESYELLRLSRASNLRKEMLQLLDEWVDAETEARMARAMLEWRRGDNEGSECHLSSSEVLGASTSDVTVLRVMSRFVNVSSDRKETVGCGASGLRKRQIVGFCIDTLRPNLWGRTRRATVGTSVLRMLERPSKAVRDEHHAEGGV
jgi:hypothetical protein